MKILSVASEIYPLVKTGGLADVAAALPAALADLGEDVRVMVPGYPPVLEALHPVEEWLPLGDPLGVGAMRLGLGSPPGYDVPLWVVDCPERYGREGGPYGDDSGVDWPDNARRFAVLARAAAMVCDAGELLGWRPDVVHAHDWQAGLLPAYLAMRAGRRPASVFTIHNIAFGGIFPAAELTAVGLPPEALAIQGVEFHGQLSFLKAGIRYSDQVTTVSPTYAAEIVREPGGLGFGGLLAEKGDRVSGILNGIDTDVWNPATDPLIPQPYDAGALEAKAADKAALLEEAGLDGRGSGLLCGVVSRLTTQKGLDLVLAALPRMVAQGVRLVLLGSGDRAMEAGFRAAARAHPRQVSVRIGYDEALAHRIQAGSDVLLVPSRFEPCGLTQMYALRYGTLPVVRRTGGLADTVVDADAPGGTGFVFRQAEPEALLAALTRAAELYRRPERWRALQRRAMAQDFSWRTSASRYRELFGTLLTSETLPAASPAAERAIS